MMLVSLSHLLDKMANNSLKVLADPNYSHVFEARIYYDNNVIYTLTSDQRQGSIDSSSFATSKSFDTPPVLLTNILSSSIEEKVFISRQMIGWKVELYVNSVGSGTLLENNLLWSGFVSGHSKTGNYWSIELTNLLNEIDKGSPLSLSANCPLVFGKCGAIKTQLTVNPLSVLNQFVSIQPISFTNQPGKPYQLVVGDTSYAVTSFVLSLGILTGINLDRPLLAAPNIAVLETTCDQSLALCRDVYKNSKNYRGVFLPSSVLSLTL
jgi:hypothetical protein